MLEKFSLATLATIDDGRVRLAFEHALRRCYEDCADRPGAEDARKVQLALVLVPRCDEKGNLDCVEVEFQIKDTVPTRKSKVYSMAASKGGLFYNDLSRDDVHQRTLDEIAPRVLKEKDGAIVDTETGEVLREAAGS